MASPGGKRSWKNANLETGDYWEKSKRSEALEPGHPPINSHMYFGISTIFRQIFEEILKTNVSLSK